MQKKDNEDLPIERRHEIFQALMDAQELHDFTPAQARQLIAGRFQVDEARLRQIEQEGRDRVW
jgi:hypothetical protein